MKIGPEQSGPFVLYEVATAILGKVLVTRI